MTLSYLIVRNLRKNLTNHYLYVIALIFSSALYFSFVTLQYDPSLNEMKDSIKGSAALGAASVMLVVIVAIFLLYANTMFIKRRSKEIGLLQLIGLTKGRIFGILSAENLLLYFGSLICGIGAGFAVSRLLLMVLLKVMGLQQEAALRFSTDALLQTILVFATLYLLIMIMNYGFIRAQSILSLFGANSRPQQRAGHLSRWEIVIGFLGIGFILLGYYMSARMFEKDPSNAMQLMWMMLWILGSVIVGTYMIYKGSVSLALYYIRRSKQGYLNIQEVLSLSSLMFRMKSNALLLTIITTVSALAIGLLSLSYISYYSAAAVARENSPDDFSFIDASSKERFTAALTGQRIHYTEVERPSVAVSANVLGAISAEAVPDQRWSHLELRVVSDSTVEGVTLGPDEVLFMGYGSIARRQVPLHETGQVTFDLREGVARLQLVGLDETSILPGYYSRLAPVAVVSDATFQHIAKHSSSMLQQEPSTYYGVRISESSEQTEAYKIYTSQQHEPPSTSQQQLMLDGRARMGLIMFIVGFLGLSFLMTSGCILYFKQMDEGEEERSSYTILRKIGFTEGDLMRGIRLKQCFNFGIPLVIGLSHSYFAVKSGWFFFGTELVNPMLLVMSIYTLLYSLFGVLSVRYFKKVIHTSL
ncbi:Bacitracin export permease protein BceB [compost metagenome]